MTDAQKVAARIRDCVLEVPPVAGSLDGAWTQSEEAVNAIADVVEAAAPFADNQVAFDAVHNRRDASTYLAYGTTVAQGRALVAALTALAKAVGVEGD